MKKLIILLVSIFIVGCGSNVTIRDEVLEVEAPPSNINSAGVVSGFGYATGGEHYIIVQSLGSPLPEPVQTSTDGRYKIQ